MITLVSLINGMEHGLEYGMEWNVSMLPVGQIFTTKLTVPVPLLFTTGENPDI